MVDVYKATIVRRALTGLLGDDGRLIASPPYKLPPPTTRRRALTGLSGDDGRLAHEQRELVEDERQEGDERRRADERQVRQRHAQRLLEAVLAHVWRHAALLGG